MKAYEEMIRETSTRKSPWYVVPADNKSFARIVIASAVINALDELGLKYPKVSKEKIDDHRKKVDGGKLNNHENLTYPEDPVYFTRVWKKKRKTDKK
jgi:hypothetical protein